MNFNVMPKTFERIHLYYGCEALGFESQGFAKPKTYRARIGGGTLKAIEDDPHRFAILPYLKPIEAMLRDEEFIDRCGPMIMLLGSTEDTVLRLRIFAQMADTGRQLSFDVDCLLNVKMAILHPDYDYSSLL